MLQDPHVAVMTMRDAWEKDDVGLFLHTLSQPVKNEVSEHAIRIGWSDIRPHVGNFIRDARVIDTTDYRAAPRDAAVPREFVWPGDGARLRRVRLEVGSLQEDFLFQQEVDPPEQGSRQASGFYVGDKYYVRGEHRSPETYLVDDSPEEGRTHWRLVFPYYPFQQAGPLTHKLQQQLAGEQGS